MAHIFERLEKNSKGFWRTYRWFIAVFIIALLCDAASTIHFMLRYGPEAEIHLVIRFMSMAFGCVVGPLLGMIGKAAAGVIVAIYLRRFALCIFVSASIISFLAAWYNVLVMTVYVPGILK